MNATTKQNIILFIDDENAARIFAELIIADLAEFRLMSAFNGQEAIKLAKQYSDELCLIISDIVLPDINGNQILRMLRKDKRFAEIPFIFQSGISSQDPSILQTVDKNINIIYKPYKQEELIGLIREALPKLF